MKTRSYFLLFVVTGLLQLPLLADTVTITVTGTVTQPGALGAGSGISVGTAFNMTLTYDTSIADSNSDPNMGYYGGSISTLAFNIGPISGSEAAGGINYISIGDAFNNGVYRLVFDRTVTGNATTDGYTPTAVILSFVDSSASSLSGEALPLSFDLAGLDLATFQLSFSGPTSSTSAIGMITSVTFESVSEPKTSWLLSLGLLGIAILFSADKTRWLRS